MPRRSPDERIRQFYRVLFRQWGRQHWWPAESCVEVTIGAILTQNTAWTNVEKALASLRAAGALSLEAIRGMPVEQLGLLIRSAGYFRQKAARLKGFVAWLDQNYGGSLEQMLAQPTAKLRQELLGLNGIGPETADSMLLYAGNHPVFVVDAYTRRILARHRILPETAKYEEIRTLFERALGDRHFLAVEAQGFPAVEAQGFSPANQVQIKKGALAPVPQGACHPPSPMSTATRTAAAQLFNEMHGLIVGVGKNYCLKSRALCDECPLRITLSRKPPDYVAMKPRLGN